MIKWLYALAAVSVFGAGYAFADALRTADIEQLKAEYAAAAQRYQAELTKKESDNAQKLADAVDKKQAEIDALDAQLAGMRIDVERLRDAAAAGSSRVSSDTGGSGKSCERRIAECQRLLAESAQLLEEGGRLVGRFSADRAALKGILPAER
ncbi:MAG: hypothetical protein EGQ76_08275 [Sutterella sp.]|uniref:hypothetical protein n=1 Tax=Duodenibacillus massiliensis TaxID=1852381 RepID=UPI000EEC332A|nr:hypothetical protein [uncultured Duodenibacillus sp.]MBE5702442.1 hypothetical protein [Sutterella sp.]HAF65255.1 hypothetical protein [Sutterella sp.]